MREMIAPPSDGAGPGYEIADAQIGVFELGFDLDTIVKVRSEELASTYVLAHYEALPTGGRPANGRAEAG